MLRPTRPPGRPPVRSRSPRPGGRGQRLVGAAHRGQQADQLVDPGPVGERGGQRLRDAVGELQAADRLVGEEAVDLLGDLDERHHTVELDDGEPAVVRLGDDLGGQLGQVRAEFHGEPRRVGRGEAADVRTTLRRVGRGDPRPADQDQLASAQERRDVEQLAGVHPPHEPRQPRPTGAHDRPRTGQARQLQDVVQRDGHDRVSQFPTRGHTERPLPTPPRTPQHRWHPLEPPDGARHAMADAADQHTHDVEQVLQPIPESGPHRRGCPGQFWIWCGANIAPINWVLGALGISLGLGLRDTLIVLVLGNLIGMALFGLLRPDGPEDRGDRHGAGPGGVRPARRLPAGGHPGLPGDRLVRGQHLDHPRPGHGPVRQARSR